ncbi:hypothetical protein TRFO_16312 [Tritrichomonas foetus]|uniref:Uncharacterized protein n=1 Tax=Tritrichomonas foetus TaxID=1144522 RepID=A0A1J4KQ89_9EUKA|nr:hypothetical protein TRFO_16312 [Tritrichomonas foetus]|eukprot:OHT13455.1 hypothetical protein TRFO_16312 [Tritrichomonas foetus]
MIHLKLLQIQMIHLRHHQIQMIHLRHLQIQMIHLKLLQIQMIHFKITNPKLMLKMSQRAQKKKPIRNVITITGRNPVMIQMSL